MSNSNHSNILSNELTVGLKESGGSTVREISALVAQAARCSVINLAGLQGFVDCEGKLAALIPSPRNLKAQSVDGMIGIVREFAERTDSTDIFYPAGPRGSGISDPHRLNHVTVFVGTDSVRATLNDDSLRTDQVILHLKKLDSFTALAEGEGIEGITQSDLVWMLRSLYPNRVSPETFLPMVRNLKFGKRAAGNGVIGHGRETVDLSIEMELSGNSGDLPEEITLNTPVFDILAMELVQPSFPIQCSVRIDAANGSFTLKPLEGELDRAVSNARRFIFDRLKVAALPDNVSILQDAAIA